MNNFITVKEVEENQQQRKTTKKRYKNVRANRHKTHFMKKLLTKSNPNTFVLTLKFTYLSHRQYWR